MNRVASEHWIWEEAGRVLVRLRTNAPAERILARLEELGLGLSLEALEGDPDMTRVRGGTSYLLTFAAAAGRDELRSLLGRL